MKHITAIIQPQKLSEVRESLHAIGIDSLIVEDVQRYGVHEDHREYYRGAEYDVGFMPKVKIELYASDEKWEEASQAICGAATTGNVGDGRVFVSNVEHTVQIKSGVMDKEIESL
jgi:nitrogen regulatory protein PII